MGAACSSDGFPESYADQVDPETGLSNVESNWVKGCEVRLAASDLATSANSICECSFSEISDADAGIPFADFVELNSQLKNDPTTLTGEAAKTPAERRVVDIVKNCIAES